MRRKDEQLKDIILDLAKEMIRTEGPDAVNIRKIAKQAGIASGTVYNYFTDKNEIMLTLTESYWHIVLANLQAAVRQEHFTEQLREIYHFLRCQIADSGGILMRGISQASHAGREKMQSMQTVLRTILIEQLQRDKTISSAVWTNIFNKEQFIDFIMANLILSLRQNANDIDFLIEVVNRTLHTGVVLMEEKMSKQELTQMFEVTKNDTALQMESGGLPVLATPRLIAWSEKTAYLLARQTGLLQEGEDTVGVSVQIEHLQASPIGARVQVTALLDHEKTKGRKLFFHVVAVDMVDQNKILEGTHQRYIINKDRFMRKVLEQNDR